MEKRYKMYIKLNIMSIFFIVVSFLSVSLAWFAYSGLSSVATEIGVKAWYIELKKNGQDVSNDIYISLSEIYPGMDTVNETINIKNQGDLDAQISYSIISARILGDLNDSYIIDDNIKTEYVEDLLSHDYPFHINITKGHVLAKGEESSFQVSISWPLDSGSDELDSLWGNKAYSFQKDEIIKHNNDSSYQIRPAIQIRISLKAEQYLEDNNSNDPSYKLGKEVLFDVANNTRCSEVSSNCLKTYVIDYNNKVGDENVSLLPDPKKTYMIGNNYNSLYNTITSSWSVESRPLLAEDILRNIATDIIDSKLIRNGISDLIIGNISYGNRINTELSKAINHNGYYIFNNNKFNFLSSNNCYWTNSTYSANNKFAINKIDENTSKLYGEDKNINCNVIPVIVAKKDVLENE